MEQEGALVNSIYYGRISSQATEQLLERFGQNGTFLLRDSETLPGAYCLCVSPGLGFLSRLAIYTSDFNKLDTNYVQTCCFYRRTPFVHTYRLVHSPNGWSLQGPISSQQTFHKLETLIETYRRGSGSDMTIVPLTDPLDKTQLPYISFAPEYLEMSA